MLTRLNSDPSQQCIRRLKKSSKNWSVDTSQQLTRLNKTTKCWPVSTVDTSRQNNKVLTRLNNWHDSNLNLLKFHFISSNGWPVSAMCLWWNGWHVQVLLDTTQQYLARLSIFGWKVDMSNMFDTSQVLKRLKNAWRVQKKTWSFSRVKLFTRLNSGWHG